EGHQAQEGAGDPVGEQRNESVNGISDVELNLVKHKEQIVCYLNSATTHTLAIESLGKSRILFIFEIPYNVLAIIKLSKGAKICEVLLMDSSNLPMMARSDQWVILFYTHHKYHHRNKSSPIYQMMVLRMEGRREKDDNADSDTSDGEIEGKAIMMLTIHQDRHPSSQRHDVNPRRRRSPSPRRSRRSSRENNGNESVNGISDVELNLGVNIREQCWLIDSGATTHTSCNREQFTYLDKVSFSIKVANQKFMQVVGKGDVHIPGLGKIKEFLFIFEIPYNDGTVQLTNDGKEVRDVIVTSGLSYFIPTINTTAQVIANLSNDGVKNGKEEGEKDDNADSDTSDGEIEGESDN
ncbi:hypothetical protein E2320_022444, partial [Naja naja]